METPNPDPSELFIGLLGPVGTDLERVSCQLKEALKNVFYETVELHLIDGVLEFKKWSKCPLSPVDKRIDSMMTAGTEFREALKRKDALALLGSAMIRERRISQMRDPKVLVKIAYIIRSIKTPQELETLRSIYGDSFFAIAVNSAKEKRRSQFAQRIAKDRRQTQNSSHLKKAIELVERDEEEASTQEYGQNLRDAFPNADFFIEGTSPDADSKRAITRFVELLFGNFRHTPSKDEMGMFHAFGASLRSSSLGRQVGAAICTPEGELVATGCNDVPRAGGGLYWDGDDDDARDHVLGEDSNDVIKLDLLSDLLGRLRLQGWLNKKHLSKPDVDLLEEALKIKQIKKASLMNIIEYGRAVHAEMAAILDAAGRGLPLKGCHLFTTTFPCHNCAKHLVAAGINRVVYVEPYPKSYARTLHGDAISIDEEKSRKPSRSVLFESFIGFSHRQFFPLFSMNGERKFDNGKVKPWPHETTLALRKSKPFAAYIGQEIAHSDILKNLINASKLKYIKNK